MAYLGGREMLDVVLAHSSAASVLCPLIELGCSPRVSIGWELGARANGWLDNRDLVTPEGVQLIAHDVFRQRLICSFEADAQGLDSDYLIDQLLQQVPVP